MFEANIKQYSSDTVNSHLELRNVLTARLSKRISRGVKYVAGRGYAHTEHPQLFDVNIKQ